MKLSTSENSAAMSSRGFFFNVVLNAGQQPSGVRPDFDIRQREILPGDRNENRPVELEKQTIGEQNQHRRVEGRCAR